MRVTWGPGQSEFWGSSLQCRPRRRSPGHGAVTRALPQQRWMVRKVWGAEGVGAEPLHPTHHNKWTCSECELKKEKENVGGGGRSKARQRRGAVICVMETLHPSPPAPPHSTPPSHHIYCQYQSAVSSDVSRVLALVAFNQNARLSGCNPAGPDDLQYTVFSAGLSDQSASF